MAKSRIRAEGGVQGSGRAGGQDGDWSSALLGESEEPSPVVLRVLCHEGGELSPTVVSRKQETRVPRSVSSWTCLCPLANDLSVLRVSVFFYRITELD